MAANLGESVFVIYHSIGCSTTLGTGARRDNSPSLTRNSGCQVKDFPGNIREADSKKPVKTIIPHNTKIIYTCPEKYVIPPDMASSVQDICLLGALSASPSCIEAPCPVTSISDLGLTIDDSCYLNDRKYIKNGCSFSVTCSDEKAGNGTCVYGEIRQSCAKPQEGFPGWAWGIIGGVVVVCLVGLAVFFGVKKVSQKNKQEKPVAEHESEKVRLNDISKRKDPEVHV